MSPTERQAIPVVPFHHPNAQEVQARSDWLKFLFQCSEAIARGEKCLSCGAEWNKEVEHEMHHADECEYWQCDCDQGGPCYQHDPGYRLYCDEMEAINEGRATRLVHCYLCEPDVNKRLDKNAGPLRGVKSSSTQRTHPTHPEADAYEVLHLVPCGHSII